MKLIISATSKITSEGAYQNGHLVVSNEHDEAGRFFKDCYTHLAITYPKYYKMDRLSQLCFLCAEFLLVGHDRFKDYDRGQIAVVIENYHASLVSDQKHQISISDRDNYFPSPSVFVYTLPNIMLGELCIRHQINGEATCLLPENKDFFCKYIRALFDGGASECCIAGRVDFTDSAYGAELYLIENSAMVGQHIAKFESIF
ncbi:MAG: 3-oxoacyl-ACP synthase [Cyclobacteriaceae bacterium]|nr:3-oxoacyl-ACP synthase [Cyclobacteriaceae bacterium]